MKRKKNSSHNVLQGILRRENAHANFKECVLAVVAKIPRGKMMTYRQVAAQAGNPLAYRAVGSIMARNWDPEIPCHRVIRSDGNLGNYNRGAARKIALLRKEGAIK